MKDDRELQAAILDEESDPIPFLEHGVEDLLAKMDEASLELDQMIERSGMSMWNIKTDPSTAT